MVSMSYIIYNICRYIICTYILYKDEHMREIIAVIEENCQYLKFKLHPVSNDIVFNSVFSIGL